MTPANLADALAYAARGRPVFPVLLVPRPKGGFDKKPLVKWGTEAIRDPETICRWWRRWPHAVIGMPTGKRSGLIVLDIDCKYDTANGFHTLADYYVLYDLPATPQAFTATAGAHLYFAVNPKLEIRNSEGEHGLGPGLDVRGEGGSIVLPSAVGGYTWHSKFNFRTVEPLIAPPWLAQRVTTRKNVAASSRGWFDPQEILKQTCDRIRTARDGDKHWQVNNGALRIGSLVRDRFLSKTDAWADLQTATASLIRHSDAHPQQTWAALEKAFEDGLSAPRRGNREQLATAGRSRLET